MKIHKLELMNINSLVGKHSIDFDSPLYQEEGIFLITGDTGSGKTTILDAISLALYGRTPRFDNISKEFNPLMSKGKGEMYSKVVFSEKGTYFTSIWSQKRAWGSSDGNLQPIKAFIYEGERALCSNYTEWKAMVVEKTGLSYDQFSKAIMLSQGKFSEFLSLGKNEKSAMLEEITGIGIYSDISIKVFNRAKSEENKLQLLSQRLQDIHLLSTEEIENKKENLSSVERKTLEIKEEISLISKAIDLRKKKEIVKEKNLLLSEMNKEKAPLEERADKDDYDLSLFLKEKEERDKLLRDVDILDNGITNISGRINETNRSIQSILNTIFCKEKEIEECRKEKERAEKTLMEAKRYLEANKGDENLSSIISRGREIMTHLSSLEKRRKEESKVIERNKKILDDNIKAESKAQSRLNELNLFREKEEEELLSLAKEREEILSLKLPEEIEESIEYYKEERRKDDVFKSLDERRKELKKGEPCPLCGSLDHPYSLESFIEEHDAKNTKLENELKRLENLKRALVDIDKRIGKKKDEISSLISEIKESNTLLLLRNNDVSFSREKILSASKALMDTDSEIEETESRLSSLLGSSSLEDLEKREAGYKKYSEEKAESERLSGIKSVLMESLNETIRQSKSELKKMEENLSSLEKEKIEKEERRNALFTGDTGEERKALHDRYITLMEAKDDSHKALEDISITIHNIRGQIEAINSDILLLSNMENPFNDNENLEEEREEREREKSLLEQEKGAIYQELSSNEENKASYLSISQKIEEQRIISGKWNDLNGLIGSSDGKKFREIAQAYTFKSLIKEANKRLRLLSDRYVLTYDEENKLDFSVIDSENDNTLRSAKSLSGGESFIVSLALALGLSSFMAKNTKIESFFLDEGFGTLDEKNLDKAMGALMTLKEEGKTIGIISHVSALKEVIPLQIKVEKNGRVSGPGVI